MSTVTHDLWSLTWGRPHVDADQLARAIEEEIARTDRLDFRTRLLIRDSVAALRQHWGASRAGQWIEQSPHRQAIETILQSDLGPSGFSTLKDRIMTSIKPERIMEYLRALGTRSGTQATMVIGGSIALILTEHLSRATEDIDVVDEIPEPIRKEHALLAELARRFGLQLTHFQSHYLPVGWEGRVRSLGVFGTLRVALVDVHDIFLSKLFSRRDKDVDDLRVLKPQLDQQRIVDRLEDAGALLGEAALLGNARENWYILYGQPLPERSSA